MRSASLVILAKAPIKSQVKTRLAAEVGEDKALEVYGKLLTITAGIVGLWQARAMLLFDRTFRDWGSYGLDRFPRYPQARGGLGDRIGEAILRGLEVAPRTVVIASDCPGITMDAFGALLDQLPVGGVALGPAEDGGFWAIATDNPKVAEVIRKGQVPWSTNTALETTVQRLKEAGVPLGLGPLLYDIDTLADLRRAVKEGVLSVDLP
jgi:glycosyltransferase A (GT-A) superfamily protein (DUF2064 family)